ncbi:tyrosine protein phosphatase [Maudiozyma humilis]|uniref:Tyrosine protein phosphatase n=1 Tax=Maudiozyma humilis TaxID=51915 RepID=A0AAV5S0M8_MAUHU|nr:tyrosine protein phosphatase [Kazachstania humilis]
MQEGTATSSSPSQRNHHTFPGMPSAPNTTNTSASRQPLPMQLPAQHANFVDLNSSEYNIKDLKYCGSVNALVNEYMFNTTPPASEENLNGTTTNNATCASPIEPPTNVLIFDLSPNESAIPSLFTVSSPASSLSTLLFNHSKSSLASSRQRFYKFHLNLPSTLLRRKNCKFENLLQVTFTDEKRTALLKLINTCNVFIFFDKLSIYSNCSIQTHALIQKFKHFLELQQKENCDLVLLSLDTNGVTNSNGSPGASPKLRPPFGYMDQQIRDTDINNSDFARHQQTKNKKKPGMHNFNLTIKIPKKSSHSMFVQSIKKDAVHYSPTSLKKYFQFDIPENLDKNDPVLPVWLRPFSDKESKSNILIKLLDNFELLEDIEVRRLSDCLNAKKQCNADEKESAMNDNNSLTNGTRSAPAVVHESPNGLQTSKSYHKIYSLTHLQKQFKKQKIDLIKARGSPSLSKHMHHQRVSDALSKTDTNGSNSERHINKSKELQLPPLIITDDNHLHSLPMSGSPSLSTINRVRTLSNHDSTDSNEINTGDSSDTLLTPQVHYEMSQGIQSFNKNRYSNILPYEHSRVRLQYSPLISTYDLTNNNPDNANSNNDIINNIHHLAPSCDGKSSSPANNNNISSLISRSRSNSSSRSRSNSNASRKRKNSSSYFSMKYVPQYNQQHLTSKLSVSPTSSLSSYTMSPVTRSGSDDDQPSASQMDIDPVSVPAELQSSGITPGLSSLHPLSDNTLPIEENYPSKSTSPDLNKQLKEPLSQFNDYFNANYLSLPQINSDYEYIATQAPLPSTIDDFWKVIMSNKVKVIVSLNSDDELQLKKWDIYWGSKYNNSTKRFTVNIVKTVENVYNLDGCTLRVFQVIKNRATPSSYCVVYQLQYSKWLDSCSVDMSDLLKLFRIKNHLINSPLKFLSKLNICANTINELTSLQKSCYNYRRESLSPAPKANVPTLVHCSAGCGRTGVFVTLDFLINILTPGKDKSNKIDVWNMDQDLIFIVINELRKQRISMVQNLTQYISCYESMLKFYSSKKNQNSINATS